MGLQNNLRSSDCHQIDLQFTFIFFLISDVQSRNKLSVLLQEGHSGVCSEMNGGFISAQRKWRKPRKQLENQSRAPSDWLFSETQWLGINISCRFDPLGVGNNYFAPSRWENISIYLGEEDAGERSRWSGSYCEFATSAPVVLLERERASCSHLHTLSNDASERICMPRNTQR